MHTTITIPSGPVFFRPEPRKGQADQSTMADSKPMDDDTNSGDFLVCRRCLGFVTTTSQKIKVNGAHIHSFTNPHGLFFDIGCFRHATGCAYSSDSSYEFTWFAGFRWQIAVCRACMEHLGWLFTSDGSQFNGLILDKLVTLESPNEKYS